MYRLIFFWAGTGQSVGAMGPTAGLSARDYLVASIELDRVR